MALALFDLDNTLLGGDSDHLWGEFLVQRGLVDGADFKRQNDAFYADYVSGNLDIHAYLRFVLAPLAQRNPAQLAAWHADFMEHFIEPIILPAAEALIDKHRQAGDSLAIITATNDFITAPIAKRLGIDELMASRAHRIEGYYTGEPDGAPCFAAGKLVHLNAWLETHPHSLADATFYSDSHNDLPLLNEVGHAVAVDPDDTLAKEAKQRGWPIISLR